MVLQVLQLQQVLQVLVLQVLQVLQVLRVPVLEVLRVLRVLLPRAQVRVVGGLWMRLGLGSSGRRILCARKTSGRL